MCVCVFSFKKISSFFSSNVHKVRPDGTVYGFIGDGSYASTASSVSSQEYGSLMNEALETKTVSSHESKSPMNKILKSETVMNQESLFLTDKVIKSEGTSNQQNKLPLCKSEIDPPAEESADM